MRRLLRVVGLSFCLFAQGAMAHPHVWIKYSAEVRLQDGAIDAIKETWRFTNGFPVQLIGLSDTPKNGVLNAAQTALFKQQAFDSLGRVGYYNHLYVDGKSQSLSGPADFAVRVEDGVVTYTFTLRPPQPISVAGHETALGIWDSSYFVDYEPLGANLEKAVVLRGPGAGQCKGTRFPDNAHPIFNGMLIPDALSIACLK